MFSHPRITRRSATSQPTGHSTALAYLLVAMAAAGTVGCAGSSGPNPGTATGPSSVSAPSATATSVDLAFCVAESNRYRTLVGKSPITESTDLDGYAATGAEVDAGSGQPHSHFLATNGGGVAIAENSMVRAPLSMFNTVQAAMSYALAAFYAEGPGGSHYENLTGPYSRVGCGVQIADATLTFVQDFH